MINTRYQKKQKRTPLIVFELLQIGFKFGYSVDGSFEDLLILLNG